MPEAFSQAGVGAAPVEYGVAAVGLGLSKTLAHFVSELRFASLPAAVVHQAKRACIDYLGCALAGSQHPTIEQLVQGLQSLDEAGQVPLLGRNERLSRLSAALVSGQSGHVLDFDDTHLGGVILHASSPMLSAMLAHAHGRHISGERLLTAFVAGFETAIRLGQAAPAHHAGGWHLTGTLGTVAAAAACANLMALQPSPCLVALGLAASQAAGMQQNRGTSAKSLHAGKAAQSGLLAAVLAERGFSASPEIFEGRKGFVSIYSQSQQPEKLTEALGERWELLTNGYKPYACGVVLHPTIDAMIAIAQQLDDQADAASRVKSVTLMVCPDAIRITGVENPGSGLMSKFSIRHAACVAFLDRAGGLAQFSDDAPMRADVQALSPVFQIQGVDGIQRDQARAECVLGDGRRLSASVEHATGTHQNPLSDAQIAQKFLANASLAKRSLPAQDRLDALWQLDRQVNVAEVFF